jgi:putative ABC transport system permease protein
VGIPFAYILRNLWARKFTTILTAGAMALVVFVFAAVLMLDAGLRATMVQTGSYDNVMVTRRGAESEVQSGIERQAAAVVETLPQIAYGAEGLHLVSKETVVLISLLKRDSESLSNVVIRGMSPIGRVLRPQVRMIAGRMFRPGSGEIIAGSGVTRSFSGARIGERLRFGQRDWTVVGSFDAGKTGFDSEIWGDADQLMQAFRRPVFSSVIFKLDDPRALDVVRQRIESDPRLTLQIKRESVYYAEQSEQLSTFIRYLGLTLSVIFSLGAMIGAMITMYAAVATRTAEIGTLRALGFRKSRILAAFLLEALAIGFAGGLAGLACASLLQFLSFSTTNFQSFSELAFSFALNAQIAAKSLAFALLMGFLGGFLPAVRAARMNIVDALRAA